MVDQQKEHLHFVKDQEYKLRIGGSAGDRVTAGFSGGGTGGGTRGSSGGGGGGGYSGLFEGSLLMVMP